MLVSGGSSDCDGGDQGPDMSSGPPRQTPVPSGKYAGDKSVSCPGGIDGLYQMSRDEFLPYSHHVDLGAPSTISHCHKFSDPCFHQCGRRFRRVGFTGNGARFEQVGTKDIYFGHQIEEIGPWAMLKVSNIQG